MYDPAKPKHFSPASRLPKLNPTPEEVREAISRVVAYNWGDELRDFNKQPDENHIYLQLRVLHASLYGS